MAPATSYCPPTRSPAFSLGVNEKGLRQLGQKPSVRPGWPSRERPTAEPQFGQMRRSSGTIGSLSTAFAASTAGTGGMDVIPAPSRAPRRRVDDVPTRRVTLLPPTVARADPSAVEASWLEARDTVEGDWAMPAGEVAVETALEVGPVAPWAAPVDAAPAGPGCRTRRSTRRPPFRCNPARHRRRRPRRWARTWRAQQWGMPWRRRRSRTPRWGMPRPHRQARATRRRRSSRRGWSRCTPAGCRRRCS